MKQLYLLIALAIIDFSAQSQTYQQSVGGVHTTSAFNSVKYDPNDSSTINAGYVFDSSKTNDRDWYLVKFDKNKNIVWQKVISNAGDDFIYKVIVCKNGDYVAVGVLTQGGIPRGFICRMNSSNGNIIWSSLTNNTSAGEICYDVVETTTGNIAVAATDQWRGSPNCFIIVLDAAGSKVWSEISRYSAPDQPYSINQLRNGNLIIGINEWVGGHYNLILAELKPNNGAIVSQNTYSINVVIPNSGLIVNSLAAWGINLIDKQVSLYCYAFNGSGGTSNMCIYDYNTATKKLVGGLLYHTQDVNTIAFTYTPLGKNDLIISESFANPTKVYISRSTNESIVYDDLIEDPVTSIMGIDTAAANGMIFSGSSLEKEHNNTYNLFAPKSDPATNTSCHIVNSNTLNFIRSVINATPTSDISFISGGTLSNSSVAFTTPIYKNTVICGENTLLNYASSNMSTTQHLKEKLFAASPNPVTNVVHFTIPFGNKASTLVIYNMNGEKIFMQKLNAGITSKDIDMSMATSGIYNAELISDDTRYYLKIIKN
jgi:hypothetical protein